MAGSYTISFHETFSLSRVSLGQILDSADQNGILDRDSLANTSLGTNYQKAMPRYAFRAGLLDKRNHLTALGRFAAENDPTLERSSTQWLLHYHLAAPHGPTAFWSRLICAHFLPGNILTSDELTEDLIALVMNQAGRSPAPRSVRSTTTVFVGTYLKADGLGRLHLLQETAADTYRVQAVPSPPVWAIGYALAEYWGAHYGERLTINMDDLTEGDFAAIFLLGEERLVQLLVELKQEGMVDLYRTSRPYQVVLLQPSLEYALQKMYGI